MDKYFKKCLNILSVNISNNSYIELLNFWDILLEQNSKINLISRTGQNQTRFTAHIVDSLTGLLFDWPANLNLVDIGSGGGFPALVLKIVRPGWSATLFESNTKKAGFLLHASQTLGLEGVVVVNEFLDPRSPWPGPVFDLATTRALASLPKTIPLAGSVLKPGGRYLAYKGPYGSEELLASADLLVKYKLKLIDSKELFLPVLNTPRILYLFEKY
jgi:16S rRNA (guanine527-N7)-methyltransferase